MFNKPDIRTAVIFSIALSLPAALAPLYYPALAGALGSYSAIAITALGTAMLVFGCLLFLRGQQAPECEQDALALLVPGIFQASNEAMLITDASTRILEVNPAFVDITGYSRDELIGQKPSMMQSGRHERDFYDEMWDTLSRTGSWKGEVWDRRKNGEVFAKWLSIAAIKGEDGVADKYIGIFSDITSIKETAEYHEFLAHYDSLTRLPNRLLFNDRLEQAMTSALRRNRSCAVFFMDLDRFKNINDTLGHNAGDRLLQEVAERAASLVRKEDTVARFGGDEFAVLLRDIRSPADAAEVADKIIRKVSEPVRIGVHEVLTSMSIGITVFPADGDSREGLMRNADIAMYHAKEQGRAQYRFFTRDMQDKVEESIRVEKNLMEALEQDQMVLYYQPQVDIRTGRIIGMEALIRRQEENWLVPPGVFLRVAEETGLIVDICDWTLSNACRLAAGWFKSGVPGINVAVNVSALQFELPGFVERVEQVLKESGLEPSLLELELTERVLMKGTQTAVRRMQELKELGVLLSIDDFGTGYSSLSYLKDFPIDKLKVDISFVREIGKGPAAEAVVRSIISLSHNLGLKVIAEGVEKKEQLDFLRDEGCDEVQGFYYSFPLPAPKLEEMLRKSPNIQDPEKES